MADLNRRDFIKAIGMGAAGLAFQGCGRGKKGAASLGENPNVLFVSIDDLNDWIEPLGGHPQSQTPNLKRLAQQAVNFTNCFCASAACNPSRTALLTGIHTYNSGMYSNYQIWREVLPRVQTLPKYFSQRGYWSGGAGKIFHNNMPDPRSWDDYYPSKEKHMPDYFRPKPGQTVNMPYFPNMYRDFDWSPIEIPDDQTGDFKSVNWVISQLQKTHSKPFFLACGIYRPHVPWYVPQKYFDMFPLETVRLPNVLDNDLDDVGERAREIAYRGGNYHKHVIEAGEWKKAIQGYLASSAFADMLLGKLLDALEKSSYAHNTIVVVWSDHGWQLGEKEHWRKFALWENVLRSVLMIKAPKGTPGLPEGSERGGRCERITSLVDIFPTLIELCGLLPKRGLDGHSLVPLLRNPQEEWPYPAISTYDFSEFSVRTERWRYTRYIDDSEELYDHNMDPEEWTNLAQNPEYAEIKKQLIQHIPKDPAPLKETSYELMPHHLPPFKSKEEYFAWKARRKK
ncbi:MAG: sulfatase-like hydrolase/transferase [Candidatus Aminicenantes bacterium]|jgi:arylsulfatase A-like enzyme